jgi:CspA family cold shock protein
MQIGTLKWFNFTKGYGFIEPSDRSRGIFLHISAFRTSWYQEY